MCLIARSVFLMTGCSGDDDEPDTRDVNARISDPSYVFRLFERRGAAGFGFPNGFFRPQAVRSNSLTTLSFSDAWPVTIHHRPG
jgi:hypothetical protein